jgi:tape measure domain-containing protein
MGSSTKEFIYAIRAQYQGTGEIKKLADDLKNLSAIKAFEDLQNDITDTSRALEDAQERAEKFKDSMEVVGDNKIDTAGFEKAQKDVSRLTDSLQSQNTHLATHSAALKQAGINTLDLAAAQKTLNASATAKGSVLASEDMLGIRSFAAIKNEIKALENAYASLVKSGTLSDAEIARAHEALLIKVKTLNAEMAAAPGMLQKAGAGITSSLLGLGAAMAGVFAVDKLFDYVGKIREISEEHTQITARLQLMSASEKELHATESQLYAASQKTGTAYAANADILARMGLILAGTGTSTKTLVSTIDTLNQSLVVSGANTEKQASFMSAFVTAMDTGIIKSRQLKSMIADNPEFGKALAQAFKTNIEGLFDFADAGQLTRERVIQAIGDMSSQVEADFNRMPVTMQRATTEMHNAFATIIGDSPAIAKETGEVSKSIQGLAEVVERNRPIINSLFSGLENMKAGAIDNLIKKPINFFESALKFTGNLQIQELKALSSAIKAVGGDASGVDKKLSEVTDSYNKMFNEVKNGYKKTEQASADSATAQKRNFTAVTDDIEKQFQNLAKKVGDIMKSIADNNLDIAGAIRDVQRSGMSEGDAWLDMRNQADEYARAAKAAAAAGDWDRANQLMRDAVGLAKSLSNEVTVDGERMTARNAKIAELNSLNKTQNQILEEQAAAAKAAASALNADTGGKLAEKLPDVAGQLGIVKDKAAEINQTIQSVGGVFTNVFRTAADDVKNVNTNAVELHASLDAVQQRLASALIIKNGDMTEAVTMVKGQLQDLAGYAEQHPIVAFNADTVKEGFAEVKKTGIGSWQDLMDTDTDLAKGFWDLYTSGWKSAFDGTVDLGKSAFAALESALDELTRPRTIEVTVHENRSGASEYATGGLVYGFANGGSFQQIFRRLSSPLITSGSGLRDDVPALLKRREFIMPDWSTDYYGVDVFEALRRKLIPREFFSKLGIRGFSLGGWVNHPGIAKLASGGFPTVSTAAAAGGETANINLTLNFPANTPSVNQANIKEIVSSVMVEMKRQFRRSS